MTASVFFLLVLESLQDAARRRIVPAILVLCFLTLVSINSCTTCNAEITTNNLQAPPVDIFGWVGVSVLGVLAVWSLILAGMLASDHLSASLEDGSGLLILTRPVSRKQFALARLFGTLLITWSAVIVMMGGASFMLSLRGDLSLWPALIALAATLVNCVSIAALAMFISLFLPRIVTFLCVVGFVGWTAIANLMSASGMTLGLWSDVLDRFGPPILSSVIIPLAAWSGQAIESVSVTEIVFRLGLWLFASLSSLLFFFAQQELSRFEAR